MLKKVIKAILIINGILLIILLVIGFNHDLEVTEYTFESPKIPKAFDGFKIVQLSDLHDRSFGDDNEDLIEAIREIDPNLIVMTGDMIDAADKAIKDETATLFQELPFVGGVISNDGGLWPEYTSGFYSNDLSTMLVSRGLGDMEIPRFNNRPEVICLTLKCAD